MARGWKFQVFPPSVVSRYPLWAPPIDAQKRGSTLSGTPQAMRWSPLLGFWRRPRQWRRAGVPHETQDQDWPSSSVRNMPPYKVEA